MTEAWTEQVRKRAVPRQGGWCRLWYAESHNSIRLPRRGTFRMASRHRDNGSGGRASLSSPEGRQILRNRQVGWADSTHGLTLAIFGLMRWFGAEMETPFVLIAQGRTSRGVDFEGQSASKQRQNNKRQIHQGHHESRGSKAGAIMMRGPRSTRVSAASALSLGGRPRPQAWAGGSPRRRRSSPGVSIFHETCSGPGQPAPGAVAVTMGGFSPRQRGGDWERGRGWGRGQATPKNFRISPRTSPKRSISAVVL